MRIIILFITSLLPFSFSAAETILEAMNKNIAAQPCRNIAVLEFDDILTLHWLQDPPRAPTENFRVADFSEKQAYLPLVQDNRIFIDGIQARSAGETLLIPRLFQAYPYTASHFYPDNPSFGELKTLLHHHNIAYIRIQGAALGDGSDSAMDFFYLLSQAILAQVDTKQCAQASATQISVRINK